MNLRSHLRKSKIIDIVTITPNTIELDSRARRLDSVFKTLGYETKIISKSKQNAENIKEGISISSHLQIFSKILQKYWRRYKTSNNKAIQHLLAPYMFFCYALWILYINLSKIRKLKASTIIVHESIFTFSVVAAKIFYKAKIIVDVHDYYTYIIPKYLQTPFDKYYRIKYEDYLRRILYKNASLLITVSESLANSLEKAYGMEFKVFRNIGNVFDTNKLVIPKYIDLNNKIELSKKRGVFIGNYKNALKYEWLKDAHWTNSSDQFEFTFIGNGYTDEFKKTFNSEIVKFMNPIDFYTDAFDFNLYDFGFLPYESTGLANQFALPNGFFLLAQSNLPLLVPKINEISRICEVYNLGLTSDFVDSEFINRDILRITSNEFLSKKETSKFKLDFNFKAESEKFLGMISNLNLIK